MTRFFFCTALAGDAKLVTGNIKHYPPAELVVTPAQFCEIAAARKERRERQAKELAMTGER